MFNNASKQAQSFDVMLLTREPIEIDAIRRNATHPKAGAVVLFCGDIRNHNQGRSVQAVEFDAYEDMARHQIERVIASARENWPLLKVNVQHRLGLLKVGECSVAIAVSAAHRAEAYEASRFIIDSIKHSAPIWKREHYEDGSTRWIQGCQACGVKEPIQEHERLEVESLN